MYICNKKLYENDTYHRLLSQPQSTDFVHLPFGKGCTHPHTTRTGCKKRFYRNTNRYSIRNTIGTQSEHNRDTIGNNRKHYIRKRIYLKNPLKRVKKALSPLEKIVEYRHIADTYGQTSGMFGGVSEKM